MGIIAETAVYKHIRAFSYNSLAEVGYYRGGNKDKEIDIVVNYHKDFQPIMIEVKYREDSKITEKDLIVEESNPSRPNLVITKKIDDFGLFHFSNNKDIYKIPAPVFLYLLGYVESNKFK